MICTKCGLEVEMGAAFCGNCGQPVQAAAQPASVAPVAPAPVTPAAVPMPAPVQTPAPVLGAPAPLVGAPAPVAPAMPLTGSVAAAAIPMPAMQGAVAPGPAYGMPAAYSQPGGGKAIASFVMGIIGLIAWLIPLIGMILGVLSLVFGTMSTRSSHRNLAIAGIVLGSITIALSLFGFVLNVQSAAKQQSASQNISTSIVQPVETNDSNLLQLLLQPY